MSRTPHSDFTTHFLVVEHYGSAVGEREFAVAVGSEWSSPRGLVKHPPESASTCVRLFGFVGTDLNWTSHSLRNVARITAAKTHVFFTINAIFRHLLQGLCQTMRKHFGYRQGTAAVISEFLFFGVR